MTLGHDVVEQRAAFLRECERLLQLRQVGWRDDHGLVGQHIQPGLDGAQDVLSLVRVVARENDDVAALLLQHAFEIVRPRVELGAPVRRLVLALVEALDALQMFEHVITARCVDMHQRVDAFVHELLHQRGVEVARIERHDTHRSGHSFSPRRADG
jgi:hypothetical protein